MKAHQVEAVARGGAEAIRSRHRRRARCRTAFPIGISTGTAGALAGTRVQQRRSERTDRQATFPASASSAAWCIRRPNWSHPGSSSTSKATGSRSANRMARRASASTACRNASSGAVCRRPFSSDIRAEIWLKLWGNMTFNPISALSRATLAGHLPVSAEPRLAAAMMTEAQAVAAQARHHLPGFAREAHRRRGEGGPSQDLDAAGRRGGTHARDRCAAGLGDGTGPIDAARRLRTWTRCTR